MSEENKDTRTTESRRLIRKQLDEFSKHVSSGDISSILLKGHLLLEYYLDHVMLLTFDKKAQLHKKSFFNKVSELKGTGCFPDHEIIISCLYSLNKVRNDLAHKLDFKLVMSQIDSIGYNLGKEYVLKRYAVDMEERKLLIWVLDEIISAVYYPIWEKVMDYHERKKSKVTTQNLTSPPPDPDLSRGV